MDTRCAGCLGAAEDAGFKPMRANALGTGIDPTLVMIAVRFPLTLLTVTLLPLTAAAQDVPPSVRTAAACAPVGVAASSRAPKIVALPPADRARLQKTLYAPGERIGISMGTDDGVVRGGSYVVRRPMRFFGAPSAQHTIGWLHVTEASASSATGEIDFACDAVAVGDVIEPATELSLPSGVTRSFVGGTLDFQRTMRVTYGTDGRSLQGDRDFVLADGGENRGASVGDRYAAFARATKVDSTVTAAAEAVVVAVFAEQSLLRITDARDAVFAGDQLVRRVGATDPGVAGGAAAATAAGTMAATERSASDAAATRTAATDVGSSRAPAKTVTFEDVYFNLDRHTLRPEAKTLLDEAVKTLQADPALRIQVEGHTCSIGTAEYNLTLGEHRARAVRAYLVEKGIAENRLTTVSYGEEKPGHDNATAAGRRLNRRAVLTVSIQR